MYLFHLVVSCPIVQAGDRYQSRTSIYNSRVILPNNVVTTLLLTKINIRDIWNQFSVSLAVRHFSPFNPVSSLNGIYLPILLVLVIAGRFSVIFNSLPSRELFCKYNLCLEFC